ncbi:MAG: hypothetical protein [Circular genetic element sp.]|nr:MAG: hypothetical protein [Circular genetic element sp.]
MTKDIYKDRELFFTSPQKHGVFDHHAFISSGAVRLDKPILLVEELGRQDNQHLHMICTPAQTAKTFRLKAETHGFIKISLSDPDDKERKRHLDGHWIYIHKGLTNHVHHTDNLSVFPQIVHQQNLPEENYREKYENIIKDLQKHNKHFENYKNEKKESEFNKLLKALRDNDICDIDQISEYLLDEYYACRDPTNPPPKYHHFRFRSLLFRLAQQLCPAQYNYMIKTINSARNSDIELFISNWKHDENCQTTIKYDEKYIQSLKEESKIEEDIENKYLD